MTFEEILADKESFIGDICETLEDERVGYNNKITGMFIENETFYVDLEGPGQVSCNINFYPSPVSKINDNVYTFTIPYVGSCFLYKGCKRLP
jgi:hypothetical protein